MDDLTGFRSPARYLGHPTVVKATTGSTSDDAKALANAGAAEGTLVLADAQSSGRGRRGRTWQSPPGENLYLSVVLRPSLSPLDAPLLTLVTGLALAEALASVLPAERAPKVKWPNDILVAGKKLAGVLVEGSLRGSGLAWVVVGVGVNVRTATLPSEVAETATSVRLERGDDSVGRAALLGAFLVRWEARLSQFELEGFAGLRKDYLARCETLGRRVKVEGREGVAVDVREDGALVLETDDGARVSVQFGEVQ